MTDLPKPVTLKRDLIEAALLRYPLRDLAADLYLDPFGPSKARRKRPERPPDGLRTPAEAANRLGITAEQVFAFVRDGELPFVNMGRGTKRPRYRFTDGDINELIEKRKEQGVQCPSTSPKSRRPIFGSTSKSLVVGFTARHARQINGKRKS